MSKLISFDSNIPSGELFPRVSNFAKPFLIIPAFLFFLHPFDKNRIVSLLQFLDLLRLFPSFINFLDCPDFFLLKHSDPVPKLLHVSLNLQPNRTGLPIRQLVALNINNDVLDSPSRTVAAYSLTLCLLHREIRIGQIVWL